MGCPTVAYTWFFMDDSVHARRGNRGTVEVKGALQLCPCGQLGAETGAMQEVQGQFSMREEAIPKVNGDVFVGAAKSCNDNF